MSKKLSDVYNEGAATAAPVDPPAEAFLVPIAKIVVGDRIRKDFANIEEFAADIAANGLMYPISVTKNYKLIDGERRLRAMRHLGRADIPAFVEDIADEDTLDLEISLNVQRESFNPIEAAAAADRLIDKYRRPVGRPKEGGDNGDEADGSEIGVNLPQFSGGHHELKDWAAKKAGLGCESNYKKAKSILADGIPEVRAALSNKVISLNWAYTVSRQKPDVQLSWLNKSGDDPDTDRKKLAEMNRKRRGDKALIRAGIDPKRVGKPGDRPDMDKLHNIIRVAPDFFSHSPEVLSKFPVRKFGGWNSLVCIECPDRRLDCAFELQKAWGLTHNYTLLIAPSEASLFKGASPGYDERVHIVVGGFLPRGKVNALFGAIKTPLVFYRKRPRDDARSVIAEVFGPFAKKSMLDASSEELDLSGVWRVCCIEYNGLRVL